MLMYPTSVSFDAALQDQNVKMLDVRDVAGAVVNGAILARDAEKRLQGRGLFSPKNYPRMSLRKQVQHCSSAQSRVSMKGSRRRMSRCRSVKF
jgi:hypothetical protein